MESVFNPKMAERATPKSGGGAAVWGKVTQLARGDGVIDLGQGYPDFPGNRIARENSAKALLQTANVMDNQYSAINGLESLRVSLSDFYKFKYPFMKPLDPASEVIVTSSGTEALYACCQALLNPGDEVLMFQPYFPWYLPCVEFAGAIPRVITLQPPSFSLDGVVINQVEKIMATGKVKLVMFNTPHNPTGHVASRKELEALSSLCVKYNILALSDEVYENCLFTRDGESAPGHIPLASISGMRDRTVTIGSASKMFSLTGWRVGWVTGSKTIVNAVRLVHGYTTFCAPTPLQIGVGEALKEWTRNLKNEASIAALENKLSPYKVEEHALPDIYDDVSPLFKGNAERLGKALESLGLEVYVPQGGYFLIANCASLGMGDFEFCEWLAHNAKVACVPMSVFYLPEADQKCSLLRFAICKQSSKIDAAIAQLTSGATKQAAKVFLNL